MLPIMKLTQKAKIKKHNNLTKKVKKTRQIIRYYNKNNTKINKNMTGGGEFTNFFKEKFKEKYYIDESDRITNGESFIEAIFRCKVAGILLYIFKQSESADSNFQKNSKSLDEQPNAEKFKVDQGKKSVFSLLNFSLFGKKRYYKKVKSIVKKVTDIRSQINHAKGVKDGESIANLYKLKSIIDDKKKKKKKLKLCLMYLFFYYTFNIDDAFKIEKHDINTFCNTIADMMQTKQKINNEDYYAIVNSELLAINTKSNTLLEEQQKKYTRTTPFNKIQSDEISMCTHIHNSVIFNYINVKRAYTTIEYGSAALDAVLNSMNAQIANDLLYLKQTKFTNTKMIDDLLNVDSNVIGYLLIDYFEISMINSIINLINSIIIGLDTTSSSDNAINTALDKIRTELLSTITDVNNRQLNQISTEPITNDNIKKITEEYKLYYNSINKTNTNIIAKERFKPIIDNIFDKIEKFTQEKLFNVTYAIDPTSDDPKVTSVKTYIKNAFDNIKTYIDADRLDNNTYTRNFLFNIFVKKYINDDGSDLEKPVKQPKQNFKKAQALVTINKSSDLYIKLAKLNKSITEFKSDLTKYIEILNTVCKNVNFTPFTNNTENDSLFGTTKSLVYRQTHNQLNLYLPFLINFSRMCFDNETTPKIMKPTTPQTLEIAQFLIHKLLTINTQYTQNSFIKAYPDVGVMVDASVTAGLTAVLPGATPTAFERFLWDKDNIFDTEIQMPIPSFKNKKMLKGTGTTIRIECNKILSEQIESIFVLFNDLYINKVLLDITSSGTILSDVEAKFHS